MAIKFYYSPQSTASVTATIFNELNQGRDKPLEERIAMNLKAGDTKKPEYIANVNPNAQVPALVLEDGTSIWESVAITIYLGETYGVDMGLWPKPGSKRGEAVKWLVWSNTTVSPKIGKIHVANAATENKDEAVAAALAGVVSSMKLVDDALKGKEYILGDYSLVDSHMYCFIWYANIMGVTFDELSNVTAWAKRVGSREPVKAAENE